uniref:Uncharacterized protein n=1 Tax=Lepeophtheirus salmonis TaxID=72036 RepID=A0A0K2U359_LEPSM
MFLGVVASDKKKKPPFFFKAGQQINEEAYYKLRVYNILLWLRTNYLESNSGRHPSHTSTKCQKFFADNMARLCSKDIYPTPPPFPH